MSEEQYRQLVRRGLAPLVDDVPDGPQWEELTTGDVVMSAPPPARRITGWLVGLGAAAVVLMIGGLAALLSPSGPDVTIPPLATTPPTTLPFDGAAAAAEVETWWRLVIAGDVEAAVDMTHPDSQFNFEGLSELIASLGDAVSPTAEPEVLGTQNQPRVCYTLVGRNAEQSGVAVFRSHKGHWQLWEIRRQTVGCLDDSSTATTLPSSGFADPPTLDQPTNTRIYFSTDNRLTEVDIDSATVTVHQVPELAPGDPLYRLVSRGDSLVFYGQTATGPAVFALDPSDPTNPVLIDDAWFFIPSVVEDRIWLATLDKSSPSTVRALQSLREVTVDGRVTVDDVTPSGGRWPIAAVNAGLIFQGDEILEIWDPQTHEMIETLPGRFAAATWENRIVACGQCDQLSLIDLDTDIQRTVDLPPEVDSVDGYGGAFSPDGRYIAVPGFLSDDQQNTRDTGVGVVLVDFENATASLVPGMTQALDGYPQVTWSPDGHWLFYSVGGLTAETGRLFAYHPGDPTAYEVLVTLDGQYYDMTSQ